MADNPDGPVAVVRNLVDGGLYAVVVPPIHGSSSAILSASALSPKVHTVQEHLSHSKGTSPSPLALPPTATPLALAASGAAHKLHSTVDAHLQTHAHSMLLPHSHLPHHSVHAHGSTASAHVGSTIAIDMSDIVAKHPRLDEPLTDKLTTNDPVSSECTRAYGSTSEVCLLGTHPLLSSPPARQQSSDLEINAFANEREVVGGEAGDIIAYSLLGMMRPRPAEAPLISDAAASAVATAVAGGALSSAIHSTTVRPSGASAQETILWLIVVLIVCGYVVHNSSGVVEKIWHLYKSVSAASVGSPGVNVLRTSRHSSSRSISGEPTVTSFVTPKVEERADTETDVSSQDTTPSLPGQQRMKVGSLELYLSLVLGHGSHGTVVFRGSLNGRPVAIKRMLTQFHRAAER